MKDLDRKYRDNALTPDELLELRRRVNESSDGELEAEMLNAWNENDFDTSCADPKRIRKIKKSIDHTLRPHRRGATLWRYYSGIAGCALLPIFIALTLYLNHENNQLSSQDITISTGIGERAGITLPDGSKAILNSMSELSYNLGEYNDGERNIRFSGEGYFEVMKAPEKPFVISNPSLMVEVLGTTFNLLARADRPTAELSLEEGKVLFAAMPHGDSVLMHPNERAILNQATGCITVVSMPHIMRASAWTRGELIYRNSKLRDILNDLEDYYNISIETDCDECLENTFTGTLSTHDLNESLEIIELSYNLKATKAHNNVLLETKK